MREIGQTLIIFTVQPIFRGMFKALAPQLLDDRPGGFIVSRQWTNEFTKVYIKDIMAGNNLPLDWVEQKLSMNYRVAYIAKVYGIPSSFVVNSDETVIHYDTCSRRQNMGCKKIQKMSKF